MAACAVLDKKVDEYKNIIANTGRSMTVLEEKEIRSDHKEKSRRGLVLNMSNEEDRELVGIYLIWG